MTEVVVTLVSVPQALPEQPVPDSDQVTPLFCASFCTVAVNGCVWFTCTPAEVGASETDIGAGSVPLSGTISMALTMGLSMRWTN